MGTAAESPGYVRNAWYVIAWDHEVRRLELMRRLVMGEPVVLYRTPSGEPVALEDRCCHRHAPLSHGRLRGDRVVCAYHGLVFDPSGACVYVPSQDSIPRTARVRSYPVVERYHWIWIWTGDPDRADPATIPDFSRMDDPAWRWRGETLHVEGSYLLVIENLMDLTHLPALHRTTLADTAIPPGEIPVRYETGDDHVRVDRWALDTPPPPYFRVLAGFEKTERVDRWMNTYFTPPAFVQLDIGAARAGTGALDGDRSQGVTTWNLNAITPETATTAHYFWAQAQDFATGDPSLSELDFRLVHKAFMEDLAIIKGQQQNIDLAPDAPRMNLASDQAGVHARRLIDERIARERRSPGAAPAPARRRG